MYNRDFDDILNECFERLLQKESVEDCLRRYPEYATELRPLLETYLSAKNAISIQPRPECKARARFEFQEALHAKFQKKHYHSGFWLPRWFTVAASVVLGLLVAGGGTAAAAANTMPDHPLYQVKLATEKVQLAVTPSPVEKAKLYAELADKRVAEIVYLVVKEDDKADVIIQTAEELNRDLEKIADLAVSILAAKDATPAPAPGMLSAVQPSAASAPQPTPVPAPQPTPAAIQPPVKSTVTPPVSPSQQTVTPPDTSSRSPNISSSSNATAPRIQAARNTENTKNVLTGDARAKLKAVLESNAANQPSVLSSIVDRAPEEAKPAIHRAIEASKNNYRKALSNLE